MNKEIHRKSIPSDPNEKKSSRFSPGPKYVLSIAILVTLVIETVKSILVASRYDDEANVKLMALFMAGAILILILYFIFCICITSNSPQLMRAFKELLAVAAFVLFLYPLFDTYFKNQDGETNPLANLIGLNSLVAILLVAMFATDILELSTYSKFLIIAFYFLMPCLKSLIDHDERTAQTYINLFPWQSILFVVVC